MRERDIDSLCIKRQKESASVCFVCVRECVVSVCVRERVCVCVCEKERQYVYEKTERERVCVVYERVNEKTERERSVWCLCVRERAREMVFNRLKERECVCVEEINGPTLFFVLFLLHYHD